MMSAPRSVVVGALAALVAAVLVPLVASPVGAATSGTRPIPNEAAGPLTTDLVGVQVGGTRWVQAYDAWGDAVDEERQAASEQVAATAEVAELTSLTAQLAEVRAAAEAARLQADLELAAARQRLARVAISAFVEAGTTSELPDLDPDDVSDDQRIVVLGETVADRSIGRVDEATDARDRAARVEREAAAELVTAQRRFTEAVAREERAASDLAQWTETVESRRSTMADEVIYATVGSSDLEVIAVDAYRKAVATVGCGISWTVLAGLGRIESKHGHAGGATVAPDGLVSPPIYGVALDGTGGNMAIPDTDGGVYDGDVELDRAVGPMQFIPSTWARWATDGNGDRVANPQNLYDATAAASRYVCATARGETEEERIAAAIFSYNRSDAYVEAVLGWSSSYAALGLR